MPNQGWWSGELRKKDGQRAGSKVTEDSPGREDKPGP